MSDGRLVVQSNNEGVPFVLANPDAPISQDLGAARRRAPAVWRGRRPPPGAARRPDGRSRADRGLRLWGRRADRPARDPPPDAGRVDGLPRRQRCGRRTACAPTTRSLAFSTQSPRRARRARRQGARGRLQHLDRGRHRGVPPPLRPAGPRRHPARGVGRGPGHAQRARRRHRHAGHHPLARLLRRPSRTRTRRSRSSSTRRPTLVPLVEAGELRGPIAEAAVSRGAGAAARRARRRRRVDLPAAARRDRRHAPPGLHPLPAAAAAHRGRRRRRTSRSSISATATASALAELLDINGLEAPDRRAARDPPPADDRRPGDLPRPRRRGCSARRSRTSNAIDLAVRRPMTRRAWTAARRWRDDRVWQAGFLIGSALGAAATVVGRRAERSARRGLVDWPARRADRGRAARASPGAPARRPSCGPSEPAYAEADGTHRPCTVDCPRHRAAGRRRAVGRRRSRRLGPGQHRDVRLAHRQARGRPARPGRPDRRRAGQGDHGARQPLGDDAASSGSCSGSWARASSASTTSRCCPTETGARPAPVRRGEHPRRRRRSLGVPLDPFRTWIALHETDPRLRVRGASVAAAVPRVAPRAPADAVRQRRPRPRPRRAARRSAGRSRGEAERRALDGARSWARSSEALFRETQAVMSLLEGFSDYVMDEVGRDLVPDVERISARFHERRAKRTAVRALDAPADRHGPQDGAVQEGRAVRPGHRRRPRPDGARRACGRARRRCRATARSTRPSAGSRASSTGRPRDGRRSARPPGRARHRARRRADGHRPEPDPVGPLSVARPRADPRRRARARGS